MNWSQIIPILLGALLAVTTTFVTKFFSDWHETRAKRTQVKRFLFAETSSCISRIDSLLRIYKQNQTPDPASLIALERTTDLFVKYRETVYFLDLELSQQVLEFYDCVDQAVEVILSMLRLAQDNKHNDYASKEIQGQMLNLEKALSLGLPLMTELKIKRMKISQAIQGKRLES